MAPTVPSFHAYREDASEIPTTSHLEASPQPCSTSHDHAHILLKLPPEPDLNSTGSLPSEAVQPTYYNIARLA